MTGRAVSAGCPRVAPLRSPTIAPGRDPRAPRLRHVVLIVVLAGCLPKPPPPPRYFAPPLAVEASVDAPVPVRIAPVESPLYLREQMAWRRSDVEFGFYEQRRWTELPAVYVERALSRALGVAPPPAGVALGDVPVVKVELRAFEEALAPVHEARVALAVGVVRSGCLLLQRDVAASRPLAADDAAGVARAVGEALDAVAAEAAADVRTALDRHDACASR